MELWKWAFRNLWRQKKRTILNAAALSLGMTFLFFGLGWMGGYHAFLFKGVQDFDTGQAQWIRSDYLDQQRRFPLDLTLNNYDADRAQLAALPGVKEASGRLDFSVKVGFEGRQASLLGRAVDYPREAKITVLAKQLVAGSYGNAGVLMGEPLAKLWGVKPGDTVFLTAVDRHGAMNFLGAPVAGVFSFGYPTLDKNVIYLDLDTAWRLLDMRGRVSRIVVGLAPGLNPDSWVSQHSLKIAGERSASLHPWQQFARETVAAVASDSESFYIILFVVFLLATLGMLNSLSMSVHERQRELGTLRALGLRDGGLRWLILREGAALGAVSLVIAAILSVPIVIWLGVVGLDLRSVLPPDLPFPFGDRFRAVFGPSVYVGTILAGFVAALVGSMLPAWRASRVKVVDALARRT